MSAPLLLFAPGAGAPSTSPFMEGWAGRLAGVGRVVRFDYGYMIAGRKRPDRPEILLDTHRRALGQAHALQPGPTVLCGKSMGSRMGCHLSLEEGTRRQHDLRALVCFGYPLRGQSGKLRDQVLLELTLPILFVQGTRDELCPLDLLAAVRARMGAPSELHLVEGGDHSLEVRVRDLKARGLTRAAVDLAILARVAAFVDRHGVLSGPGPHPVKRRPRR
jgi:predicted alpha/beta-hydrolase family hydrolase